MAKETDILPKSFQRHIRDIPDHVLNSVVERIEPYVVLLVHRGNLAGSGTLVSSNNNFGVLTARHVPQENGFDFRAGSGDILQLCIDDKTHSLSIPMDYLERIDIGVPVCEAEGPDIAFIRIPPGNHLEAINAYKSFWNLDHDRESRIEICKSTNGALCTSYHADERTIEETDDLGKLLYFPASIGWGTARRVYEMHGFDYYELGLDPPNKQKGVPDKFGGASGGGV
jgi:hypothetical protein